MQTVEQRLIELETKCAYQDDALQVLGDEIARQQRDLEAMQLLVRQLQERLASQGEPAVFQGTARDNIPPHW